MSRSNYGVCFRLSGFGQAIFVQTIWWIIWNIRNLNLQYLLYAFWLYCTLWYVGVQLLLNDLCLIDTETLTVTYVNAVESLRPTPIANASLTVIGNKCFVFGGTDVKGACYNDVRSLDVSDYLNSNDISVGEGAASDYSFKIIVIGDACKYFKVAMDIWSTWNSNLCCLDSGNLCYFLTRYVRKCMNIFFFFRCRHWSVRHLMLLCLPPIYSILLLLSLCCQLLGSRLCLQDSPRIRSSRTTHPPSASTTAAGWFVSIERSAS